MNFRVYGLIFFILSIFLFSDGYLDEPQSIVRPEALKGLNDNYTGHLSIDRKGLYIDIYYPKHVGAGEYFTIKAKMHNGKRFAYMGGLTLSFPQMIDMAGRVLDTNFDSVTGYPTGSKIYNRHLRRAMRSQYYMVEGWEKKWYKGQTKYMILRLKAPNAVGTFYIDARGVLLLNKKPNRYEITLPLHGIEDQQGYKVKRIRINII